MKNRIGLLDGGIERPVITVVAVSVGCEAENVPRILTVVSQSLCSGSHQENKSLLQLHSLPPANASLHGGMSIVLAETLASWAAAFVVDQSLFHCVGQEINANHIRAVSSGWVHGEARPHHIGKSSHVWAVKITNEDGKLVCVSRVTMAVLSKAMQY